MPSLTSATVRRTDLFSMQSTDSSTTLLPVANFNLPCIPESGIKTSLNSLEQASFEMFIECPMTSHFSSISAIFLFLFLLIILKNWWRCAELNRSPCSVKQVESQSSPLVGNPIQQPLGVDNNLLRLNTTLVCVTDILVDDFLKFLFGETYSVFHYAYYNRLNLILSQTLFCK